MSAKHYELELGWGGNSSGARMQERPEGEYVTHEDYAALEKLCQQQHEALVAIFGFFDSGEFVRNTSHDSEEGWHLKMISIFKSLSDGQAALNAYAALFPKTGGPK